MKTYYTLNKIKLLNAPVSVHWSALLVIAIIIVAGVKQPIHALIAAVSYFSILVIHELGHGLLAKKYGCTVYEIKIGFLHGVCVYEQPYNEEHDIKIAWGGVIAQLIIAIPLIVLSQYSVLTDISYFGPVYAFLGYISLIFVVFNLAPAQGLDGGKAWKIIPLLLKSKPKKKEKKV